MATKFLKTVKVYKLQKKGNNQLSVTLPKKVLNRGWQKGDLIKVLEDPENPTILVLKNISLEERLRTT